VSIKVRIEDALFLWDHGRREGAFLSALIAVAATSRQRFAASKVRDREAFERFLESTHSIRLAVEYRGALHSIEHIFYKWFRCELVHEGALPIDIEFLTDVDPRQLSIRAGGAPAFVLRISPGWFHHLVGAVIKAPENHVLFSTGSFL
jgi:hypothetical protein